jgi:hypothetical protein
MPVRLWAPGVAVLLLIAAGVWTVYYRGTWHAWPWQSEPDRIHWCGRDYDPAPGPAVAADRMRRLLGGPLVRVDRLPPLRSHDLIAARDAARRLERPAGPGSGCATGVALRLGAGRYRLYSMQGGL